jgi:CO/xanthine dehydrogenase FAD-binding subunit
MWQEYLFPPTVEEAVATLARYDGDARIIAGGTDLLLQLFRGDKHARCLVDITRIPGLDGVTQQDGYIRIGSNVTHAQLADSALLAEEAPSLAEAASTIGSPQVRNVGTIGGNIVTASPAADTVPPLLCLDARARLVAGDGERNVPLEDLLTGPREIDLRSHELLASVEFRRPPEGTGFKFLKIGRRNAMAVSVASMAVLLQVRDSSVEVVRLAMGAVAPTVVRCRNAEERLTGQPLNDDTIRVAARALEADIKPISDLRASARYRMLVAQSLLERGLREAARSAQGGRSAR